MADWKQITARIRRARTSKDPAGQLSNLYQKTRDAMGAFELAKFFSPDAPQSRTAASCALTFQSDRRKLCAASEYHFAASAVCPDVSQTVATSTATLASPA